MIEVLDEQKCSSWFRILILKWTYLIKKNRYSGSGFYNQIYFWFWHIKDLFEDMYNRRINASLTLDLAAFWEYRNIFYATSLSIYYYIVAMLQSKTYIRAANLKLEYSYDTLKDINRSLVNEIRNMN